MPGRGRGRRAPSRGGGRHAPSRHEIERIAPSTTALNSESSASKSSASEPQVDSSEIVMESENANTESRVNSRARGITCGIGARKAMRTAKDRLRVEFDFDIRQPICNNAESFNNEIGYIVRNYCSLQYKEWRLVPPNVRGPLREKLLSLFDIDLADKGVQDVIDSQMQRAWKGHKYKLHKHFKKIGGNEDSAQAKSTCPDDVKKEDWEYLCDLWADDQYKERAMNNAKARGKRKWESRNGSKSTARHHIARGVKLDAPTGHIETWRLRHWHSEKGWSSTESEAKYEEMMQLRRDHSVESMTDKMIFEKVLGRQSNRLFGWGRSPSKSRRTCGETSSRPTYTQALDELKQMKADHEALKDNFLKMQQKLIDYNIIPSSSLPHEDDDDVDVPELEVQLLQKNEHLQGKLVVLSLESGTNIVAYGTVVKVCEPSEKLSGDCVRVSIDEAVDESALLPIPTSEYHSIGDAVGSHVSWPTQLLKVKDEKTKINRKKEQKTPTMDSNMPVQLHLVYLHYTKVLKDKGTTKMQLHEDVFGHERLLYIHIGDVEPFCKLRPISYNCMAVYIWHLYMKMRSSKMLEKFKFVDPFGVGHIPSIKKDKNTIQQGIKKRARALSIGLKGTSTNQMVLVPCNVGAHWILTVIDPHNEEIGLLDPLYHSNHDVAWKQVIEMALKMFNADIQKEGKEAPSWTIIKGPKQPDCYQCGYYVMRYMKEIVALGSCETISSIKSLGKSKDTKEDKKRYSNDEINEVRKEWAKCLQKYLQV